MVRCSSNSWASFVHRYCVPDEAFLTELQVKDGPNGKKVSVESGHPVEWVSEKNWMFKYAFSSPFSPFYF